jgi:hypothetical protein
MAQTGFTPIQLYSTSTAAAAPVAGNLTNSTLGSELAINITDGKLFYKDNANAVQVIGWKTVPTTAGGTGLTTYTAGDLSYYASGTTFTKLAIGTIGQILTSTGSAPQWTTLSGVAVTTFSAGTTGFTPNSATSGAITLAGTLATTNGGTGLTSFTANSVFYASSTSAIGQSANLTFNGTTLTANTIGAFTLSGTIAGGGNQINNVIIGTSTPLAGFFTTLSATGVATFSAGSVSAPAITTTGDTNTGIFFPAADTIAFTEGGAESMRIHSSGGVSIGNTTDPSAGNLGVNGKIGVGVTPTYALQVSPGTYSDQLAVFNEAGTWTGNGGTVIADYYNATTMICGIKYSASTATSGFVTIHAGGTTERARFSPGGGMSIGTTTASPTNGILLPSNGILNTDGGTLYSTSIAGSTTGSGANMYIDAAGGFIQRSTSSIKYKTDIENLEPTQSSSIYEMRPVWYRSLCEMDRKDWSYYGLIAEEVAEIEPRLVFWGEKNEDGTQQAEGVMYDRLTVFLLAELQKQQKIIEQLKEKVGL